MSDIVIVGKLVGSHLEVRLENSLKITCEFLLELAIWQELAKLVQG